MKSRLLKRRHPLRAKARLARSPAPRVLHGLSKQERNRRLSGLGLSKHDDEKLQTEALAIVERFLAWTRRERCAVSGYRTGEYAKIAGQEWKVYIEAAHVTQSRGSWAGDFGVVIPMLDLLHAESHRDPDFWTKHSLEPVQLAKAHAVRFFAAHEKSASWIIANAQDGDAISLAQEGLAAR